VRMRVISVSILLVVMVTGIIAFGPVLRSSIATEGGQDDMKQPVLRSSSATEGGSPSPAREIQKEPRVSLPGMRVREPRMSAERPEPLRPISRAEEIDQELTALQAQIASLKSEHTKLIEELEAIHQIAVEEQATQTTVRLKDLITVRRREFDERLQNLERRHKRLQQIQGRTEVMARIKRPARKAPEFTLTSFDGKSVSLSDYKNKIVVLEWFSLECPFSKYHYETKNTMIELAKKYKDKNVVWLAINSTSHTTAEANKFFVRRYELPYPILDDTSGNIGRAYGARTTPHMYVIDNNGMIVYQGAIDNAPLGKSQNGYINYVDKALAELIEGKEVSMAYVKPYGCSVKYGPEK
jgi:peroxiredoxin